LESPVEPRPRILRTPDDRFADLPGFPFAPHHIEIADRDLGSLRMHFIDEGPPAARAVLMLHGNPTWSFLYRHMIRPVTASGYRVVAPDMIGFGRSDKPADRAAYSYDAFVRWMRAFIDMLDLRGITLVCQDWGGPIGLRLVAEMPDRFDAVFATNTLLPNCERPPRGVEPWPGEMILGWIETCRNSDDLPVEALIARAAVAELAPDVLAGYAAPFPDASFKAGMLEITCGIPIDDGAQGLAANRAAWEALERWTKPFTTAFSDGDPATAAWADVFRRRIPGARDCAHPVIQGAGHFVQEERGPEIAAALIDFLESNRRRAGTKG